MLLMVRPGLLFHARTEPQRGCFALARSACEARYVKKCARNVCCVAGRFACAMLGRCNASVRHREPDRRTPLPEARRRAHSPRLCVGFQKGQGSRPATGILLELDGGGGGNRTPVRKR